MMFQKTSHHFNICQILYKILWNFEEQRDDPSSPLDPQGRFRSKTEKELAPGALSARPVGALS